VKLLRPGTSSGKYTIGIMMIYKLLCRLHCKSKTKILRFKINPITKMPLNFNTIQIDGYIALADLIAAIRNWRKNCIEKGSLHFQEKID
jgi:hypothetical protein